MRYDDSNYEDEPYRSRAVNTGAYIVINKIIKEQNIKGCMCGINDYGKGLLLDMASCNVITGNDGIDGYDNYAYRHPLMTPGHKIFSNATVKRFCSEIDDEFVQTFLGLWNSEKADPEKSYILIESADCMNNIFCFDRETHTPLCYKQYVGERNPAELESVIAGFKSQEYTTDICAAFNEEYFSRENMELLYKAKYDYAIVCSLKDPVIREIVLNNMGSFENKKKNYIRKWDSYAVTVKTKLYSEDREVYVHIYYMDERGKNLTSNIQQNIEYIRSVLDNSKGMDIQFLKMYETYFELKYDEMHNFTGYSVKDDAIEIEKKLAPYSVIVTSSEMTAAEAIDLYRYNDYLTERFNRNEASDNSGDYGIYNISDYKRGFIDFLSLIICNGIETEIDKFMNESVNGNIKYLTLNDVIAELECIELIRNRGSKYGPDRELSFYQILILGAFGINVKSFKTMAETIGMELEHGEPPEEEYDRYEDWDL